MDSVAVGLATAVVDWETVGLATAAVDSGSEAADWD